MKILHLIIDHQVIERTLSVYERVFPNSNEVVVFNNGRNLKHVKEHAHCLRISSQTVKKEGRVFDFSSYDHIIAHYLTFEMIDFIKYAPSRIKVCWEIYGYDLYNQFLEPLGYQLQQVDEGKYESFKVSLLKKLGIRGFYLYVRSGNGAYFAPVRNSYFKRITSRIDSVSVCCYGDAKLLEQYTGRKYDVYKSNNYSLHETLGDLYGSDFNTGGGILVGNSASFTNNHLYVLDFLKTIGIGDSNIVMPLSYGGNQSYKQEVIEKYSKAFSSRVDFLLDYMPLHEYNKIFLKLKTMILASWRQESIGTIMMGFYLGIKIYMSEKSPLFQSLKEEGFVVYEIEGATANEFAAPLGRAQQEHNRNLLLDNYSEKCFENELKRQFS